MIVELIAGAVIVVLCLLCSGGEPEVEAGVYRLPGRWYWLKRIAFFCLFRLRSIKKNRGNNVDSGSDIQDKRLGGALKGYGRGDGYNEMEKPQPLSESVYAIDCAYFGAVNKDGCNLVCRVARRQDRCAEVWLFLEVPGLGCFQHPRHPDTDVYFTDGHTFKAGGLVFEILEPMKRWKVSYSGKLRRGLCNDISLKPQDFVEVSFSFTWSAFSRPFNFDTDMASSVLGDSVARECWDRKFLERLKAKHQSHYEQWGELRGRLCVDGQKTTLYLQSVRDHSFGERDWRTFHRYIIHFIYLESGMCIQVGVVSQPCLMSHVKIGYVSYANGDIVSVTDVNLNLWQIAEDTQEPPPCWSFSFIADGQTFIVKATRGSMPVWYHHDDRGGKVLEVFTDFQVNSLKGRGIAEYFYRNPAGPPRSIPDGCPLVQEPSEHELSNNLKELSLPFSSLACRSAALVGGKGAQLAQLSSLQTQVNARVPPGFCLTLKSCQLQFQTNTKIEEAVAAVTVAAVEDLPGLPTRCGLAVEAIVEAEVCPEVRVALIQSLRHCFGWEFEKAQLAVRSSAAGEDGAEASSAGQMDTVLGVIGVSQVLAAVSRCWASAYTYQAVEYRRQHGQSVRVMVGLVIQQMVPADTAGVMFTADPISASASSIVINANFGLGESVVSGRSDPDAISVTRDPEFPFRLESLHIDRVTPGEKRLRIVHSAYGGVVEEEAPRGTGRVCLTDGSILKLASLGIQLEKRFGSPRDIEWAMVGEDIFMLQCRPITVADSDTEEDLIHEFDSPMTCDYQWLTTSNISEMMPGAVTPLTLSTFASAIEYSLQMFTMYLGARQSATHLPKCLPSNCNHHFICLLDVSTILLTTLMVRKDSMEVNLLGSLLPDLTTRQTETYFGRPRPGLVQRVVNFIRMIKMWYTASCVTAEWEKQIPNYTVGQDASTARELYQSLCHKLVDYQTVWAWTLINSGRSGNVATVMMSLIGGDASEWTSDHYGDIALLLSKCDGVSSAEVPHAMEDIAREIVKTGSQFVENFKHTPDKECLKLLHQHPHIEKLMTAFLDRHGHRCLREAELRERSWRAAPEKLISVLKAMLKTVSVEKSVRPEVSVEEILCKLKTTMPFHKRLILKRLLPRGWKEVGAREWGKSVAVQMSEVFKLAYSRLARLLHKEGMLPDDDLMYFLTHQEIGSLLSSHSPHLVIKAQRRRKVLARQMEAKFEKINMSRPVPIGSGSLAVGCTSVGNLKGMPVSQGQVTGPAQVVLDLQGAWRIKAGDILVVSSTDVGWSPYFPLIAGLVTELGGLISHGAVVAREYGIPCVVNVAGATRIIRSGEMLQLDGRTGTVKRLIQPHKDH